MKIEEINSPDGFIQLENCNDKICKDCIHKIDGTPGFCKFFGESIKPDSVLKDNICESKKTK